MEKRIYLNELYDCYKKLFTEKQQEYFENYYYENLSLAEIAENSKVSRNAVHNQLKIVEEKLIDYENKLGNYKKKQQIMNLISNEISDEILNKIIEIL